MNRRVGSCAGGRLATNRNRGHERNEQERSDPSARVLTGAIALAAVFVLGGCGETYVDSGVSVSDSAADTTTTTLRPVDPNAPIELLLIEIESLMFDLDQRIIDENGHIATMARIDEVWFVAEEQIRADDPDDVFNFEQAIELARSGVERRRPADASKGLKIMTDVVDAYLDR